MYEFEVGALGFNVGIWGITKYEFGVGALGLQHTNLRSHTGV